MRRGSVLVATHRFFFETLAVACQFPSYDEGTGGRLYGCIAKKIRIGERERKRVNPVIGC